MPCLVLPVEERLGAICPICVLFNYLVKALGLIYWGGGKREKGRKYIFNKFQAQQQGFASLQLLFSSRLYRHKDTTTCYDHLESDCSRKAELLCAPQSCCAHASFQCWVFETR